MFSQRLAFAALGLACVTAAAGGSYLATRHNVADQAIRPASAPADVPALAGEAVVPASDPATPSGGSSRTAVHAGRDNPPRTLHARPRTHAPGRGNGPCRRRTASSGPCR